MLTSFVDKVRGAHTSVPFWVGVGILTLLLVPRRYGSRGFTTVALLGVLWWSVLLVRNPPQGSNYAIYRTNAELTLRGQPSFGRWSATAVPDSHGYTHGVLRYSGPDDPRYLDY